MPKGSGRRPLPSAIKKLRGNPGKRAHNTAEPKAPIGAPKMPAGLDKLAIAEWKAIVPLLLALGVLTQVDGKALAAYCMAYARWMEAHEEVQRLGLIVEEPIVGLRNGELQELGARYKRNPAVSIEHEAMKIMKAYLVEFGLTPSSRARLRIEKPTEADPFDAFAAGASSTGPSGYRVN